VLRSIQETSLLDQAHRVKTRSRHERPETDNQGPAAGTELKAASVRQIRVRFTSQPPDTVPVSPSRSGVSRARVPKVWTFPGVTKLPGPLHSPLRSARTCG